MKDLDIVNLIEMIKGYQVMKKVLFNQTQLLLLRFQRRITLFTATEESSEDQQLYSTVRDLVEPSKPNDKRRRKARAQVSNTLRKFEGASLSQNDQRILQGILTKDFTQKEEQKTQNDLLKAMRQRIASQVIKKIRDSQAFTDLKRQSQIDANRWTEIPKLVGPLQRKSGFEISRSNTSSLPQEFARSSFTRHSFGQARSSDALSFPRNNTIAEFAF